MSNEWRDLPTFDDVAEAKRAGDEIQTWSVGEWVTWNERNWSAGWKFRARKPLPKTKKVKMLCWFDECSLDWYTDAYQLHSKNWIRVPSEDKEIEVPYE